MKGSAILAVLLLASLGVAPQAGAADAPFGFAWSEGADSLPPPSTTDVDGNIKELTYRPPHLPPQATETDIVIARVCDKFGLQQVEWFSHAYAFAMAISAFLDVYQQGVHQYGEAQQADLAHGTAVWISHRIRMQTERDDDDGQYRIVVSSDGPQFGACQAEHDKIAGHR